MGRVLELYEKQEVFRSVKKMSLKEFKEYAKGEEAVAALSKVRVAGNQVFIGKKLAVTLTDELAPKTRSYFAKITAQAREALEAGEVLYTTRLYDTDELRKFERAAERLKKEIRTDGKAK